MEILTWQARTDRHLTLKQLEALTGISKSTLNTIENGITSPTLRQLEAIAVALDVKITDLFDSEYNDKLCADNASDAYFLIYGNNWKRSFIPMISMIQSRQEKGGKPMIRKRINTLLNKLSDAQLKRIYKYIKYVYIHG